MVRMQGVVIKTPVAKYELEQRGRIITFFLNSELQIKVSCWKTKICQNC